MTSPIKERVAVFVTRTKNEVPQMLVTCQDHRRGASVSLPETTLLPEEHPAEAAWRLVKNTFDKDACQTFHKLAKVSTDGGGYHVFQTGLGDEALDAPGSVMWLEQSEATASLCPSWGPALEKLR